MATLVTVLLALVRMEANMKMAKLLSLKVYTFTFTIFCNNFQYSRIKNVST